jgi:RimJ/RimL family protein N-acetyltransferase
VPNSMRSRKFQAQGLMPESRIPIIAWICECCGAVARIHSEIETTNIRSIKMNEKLNFQKEALLRDFEGTGAHIEIFALRREKYLQSEIYRPWREFLRAKLSDKTA